MSGRTYDCSRVRSFNAAAAAKSATGFFSQVCTCRLLIRVHDGEPFKWAIAFRCASAPIHDSSQDPHQL